VTLTGCSLLYAPSSDLTSGGDVPGDGGDAAESGPRKDGSSEGAADADAGVPACPPNALLCDDFERTGVLGPFVTAGGNVAITTSHAHSPTRSLSAIAKAKQDSPAIGRQLTLPPRTTLSFWLYTPTAPPVGTNFRVAHVLWGDACSWELSLAIFLSAGGGLTVSSASYDLSTNPSCGPLVDDPRTVLLPSELFVPVWHHVVVKMDVSQRTRLVDSTVDEKPIAPAMVKSVGTGVPSTARVDVGIPCINSSGGCFTWDGTDYEVLLDDVMLIPSP
jgi:hypothetical protein